MEEQVEGRRTKIARGVEGGRREGGRRAGEEKRRRMEEK